MGLIRGLLGLLRGFGGLVGGCIWAVYPLQTNPFGPRLNQNLPTNRPEVLAKYGWGISVYRSAIVRL